MLLYDRTSDILNVNYSRKHLFIQKSRSLETCHQLKRHSSSTQGEQSTRHTAGTEPCLLSRIFPTQQTGGGKRRTPRVGNRGGPPFQRHHKQCYELMRCGCKKGCTQWCKCVKASLKCTALCHCGGKC